ncbi:hypothetical protein ACLESO_48130 [Pyxidicoccus sp. 3LG]
MALNVRRIREEAPKDFILVLAGNNPTRVDVDRSMGGHLRLSGLPLTSLNVGFSGGSLWTCRGPTCGAEPLVTSTPDGKPSLDLTPQAPMSGGGWGEVSSSEHPSFHGKLFIGKLSASPPAGTPDDPSMPKPSL